MSTLDYLAQPDFITSRRRLLATRVLSVLSDNSIQQAQSFPLKHKREILKGSLEYLRSVENGFYTAHMGIHSAGFTVSTSNYNDLSTLLGDETKYKMFPVRIENYCKTIEALLTCRECSDEKISELKSFFSRIAQYNDTRKPFQLEH